MTASRRDFLQIAGSAAAAITLGQRADAEQLSRAARPIPEDPAVKALEDKLVRARPVPLDKVRLTGGPLKLAQDADAKYLLSLEPDRMMAYYRIRAGLPQKKAEPYDGWDGDGRNLTGHIAGHHLSAVSLMYLATGDARFKARADYLVREMKEVQDKHGDGYLGAILSGPGPGGSPPKDGRQMFADVSKGDIRSGGASTSTASGRRGTRCTRPSRVCATRTATPATRPRSTSRSSSPSGPRACSRRSATRRSRRCSTPSTAA